MKSLKEHRLEQNPMEKLLVDEFIRNYSEYKTTDLIVFGQKDNSNKPNDHLSDRERDIVVSTIQWLGSPVGIKFLQDLLK